MALFVLLAGAALERRRAADEPRSAPTPGGEAALAPIGSEADVFRVTEADLAVAPGFADDRPAHVRSLEMYRRTRAYPGAPPRIPHGLTAEEFRDGRCNVCHQRGGWVARFATYAPVTPHSDYGSCLQCHVPRDELVGRPLPDGEDGVVCTQCHVDPDADAPAFVDLDWRSAPWPERGIRAMEGSPNLIPHPVESRGACLSCHAGPGAVVELRIDHPERVNCRQCHVPAADVEPFGTASEESGLGNGGGT